MAEICTEWEVLLRWRLYPYMSEGYILWHITIGFIICLPTSILSRGGKSSRAILLSGLVESLYTSLVEEETDGRDSDREKVVTERKKQKTCMQIETD